MGVCVGVGLRVAVRVAVAVLVGAAVGVADGAAAAGRVAAPEAEQPASSSMATRESRKGWEKVLRIGYAEALCAVRIAAIIKPRHPPSTYRCLT